MVDRPAQTPKSAESSPKTPGRVDPSLVAPHQEPVPGARPIQRTLAGAAVRIASVSRAFASATRRYPRDLAASLLQAAGRPTNLDSLTIPKVSGHASELATAWNLLSSSKTDDGRLRAFAWLGHNTVLLRAGGLTVLTDPVLSHRIGVRLGPVVIGPGRLAPPPLDPEALPPIDLILLSHAHFDHLDRPTLRRLANSRTRVITARGTRRLIPRGFGNVQELHWNAEVADSGLHIQALRPAHWGARTAWDRHRGFNSYTLQSDRSRILYAGDTAFTNVFDGLGPFDLGIFGIGAYDPWIEAHASPEQVWSMAKGAGVRMVLPVHHSTFKLSDEPVTEPLERLLAVASSQRSPTDPEIRAVRPGAITALDTLPEKPGEHSG